MGILGLIPTTWLLPAAGIAATALIGWGGVQTVRVHHAEDATAEVQKSWDAERARASAAALLATTAYRALEDASTAKVRKAEDDYMALQARHLQAEAQQSAALAAQRVLLADNGRLRGALAAYASGGGASAPATAASESDRAVRLGNLLGRALSLDAEILEADGRHADAAESASDSVRALLMAWPANP